MVVVLTSVWYKKIKSQLIFTLLFPLQNPLDVVSFLLKILPIQLPMTRDSIAGWTIWRQDILDGGQDMKDLLTSKTIETIHNWNKKHQPSIKHQAFSMNDNPSMACNHHQPSTSSTSLLILCRSLAACCLTCGTWQLSWPKPWFQVQDH